MSKPKEDKLLINVNLADYTPTELMQEIQRIDYRDPHINEVVVAAFRKMADGIESKDIGLTRIMTTVDHTVGGLPECMLSLTFHDQLQYKKMIDRREGNI